MTIALGFIGFGEAGFNIANGLREAGLGGIAAYDIHTHTPGRGELIQERARESRTTLVESSAELAQRCDVFISTVTANSAVEAAGQTAPYLERRHLYADMNSVAPATKQRIERIISETGARFVEAAIMSPVPPQRHRVPMLLGGPHAEEFAGHMRPYGMRLDIVANEIGTAAAIKMFRSIMVKGMEALALECALGASRYGASKRVFDSLAENFPGLDWDQVASYMISRVVVHGERRAREMEEVAATLRALDIEPVMAEATVRRQDWCAKLGIKELFGKNGPDTYDEVVSAIENLKSAAAR